MQKVITLALTLFSSSVLADPTVFGMELGKMTEPELQAMYDVNQIGVNTHSGGNAYSIPVKEINFKGIAEVTAIFNKQGYLVAVLNKLPKRYFNSLNKTFTKSYTLVSIEDPFVGNKSATYKDGATEITINSPHNDINMSLNYTNMALTAAFNRQHQEQQ